MFKRAQNFVIVAMTCVMAILLCSAETASGKSMDLPQKNASGDFFVDELFYAAEIEPEPLNNGDWKWPSPTEIASDHALYVGNDPVNFWDPDGLAWEPTETQGVHYNERGSSFGFGLDTDSKGNLKPVPLPGKSHTFDSKKAWKILNDTAKDKTKWKNLKEMNAKCYATAGDQGRFSRVGRALRRFRPLVLVGVLVATVNMTNAAENIYEKLKSGNLNNSEIDQLIMEIGTSGAPSAKVVVSELVDYRMSPRPLILNP